MKRALLLVVLVLAPSAQARVTGGTPVALVTAETVNQLVAVEMPSGKVLKRISMPADPQNIEVRQIVNLAVVVSARAGAVSLVDTRRLRILKVLRGFGSPHIAVLGTRWAYVTDDARGQLAVIDLKHRRVARKLFVGFGAHHMAVNPDWTRLWIALGESATSIAVVDVSAPWAPRLIGHVDPSGRAHDLAFAPSGNHVWVTYADRRTVSLFDARSGKPALRLRAGQAPQHVAFDPFFPPRHAYITSGDDGALRIVSLRTLRTLRTVRLPKGSFNLTAAGGIVVVSSLTNGTLTELTDDGRLFMRKRIAPAARDVAVVVH